MKKITSLILCLMLFISAVSCSNPGNGADTSGTLPDSGTQSETAIETQPAKERPKSMKVLATGHSNIATSVTYLTYIAKDLGTDMLVGLLWRGDATFGTYVSLHSSPNCFWFGKSNLSTFGDITVSKQTVDDHLAEEDWDIITINQGHLFKGYNSKNDLPKFINIIRSKCPDTPIYNNISLAFMDGCTNAQFLADWQGDTDAMYRDVIEDVKENIAPNENIAGMIPTGTLIKSLTTSKYKDSIYAADRIHLGTYGAYAAGILWYAVLTGASVDGLKWMPAGMEAEFRDFVIELVPKIIANPYEMIDFGQRDSSGGEDGIYELKAAGYMAKTNGFNIDANDKSGVDVSSADGNNQRCIWIVPEKTVGELPYLNYSLWDGGITKICVTKKWNDGVGDLELPVDVGAHSENVAELLKDAETDGLGYVYVTVYTSSTEPVSITHFCFMNEQIAG